MTSLTGSMLVSWLHDVDNNPTYLYAECLPVVVLKGLSMNTIMASARTTDEKTARRKVNQIELPKSDSL